MIFFRTDIEGDFFLLHDVSRFKGCLFFLDSVVSLLNFINARVRDRALTVIYRFIYQVVKRVGSLTINTTLGTEQGRSRFVIVGIDAALSQFIQIYRLEHLFDVHAFTFKQFGVVVVPFQGVGDVEGNQITGIVRNFVRNAEHRVGTRLMRFAVDVDYTDVGIFLLNGSEIFGQQYQTFFVVGFAGLGIANGHISRIDKVRLVGDRKLRPIPVTDRIVLMISVFFNQDTIVGSQHSIAIVFTYEISIFIGVDALQGHTAFGTGSNGKRNVDVLFVCLRRTGVTRNILIVDIEVTTDIPEVGLRIIIAIVGMVVVTTAGETIVHNALGRMHKVSRSLQRLQRILVVSKVGVRNGTRVGKRKHLTTLDIIVHRLGRTMFVVRIHITTTFAGFHIDQIELYHTGDGAVSFIAIFVFFFHQFKEYPRSLSHHVLAGSHVAGTLVHTLVFEFQVS